MGGSDCKTNLLDISSRIGASGTVVTMENGGGVEGSWDYINRSRKSGIVEMKKRNK